MEQIVHCQALFRWQCPGCGTLHQVWIDLDGGETRRIRCTDLQAKRGGSGPVGACTTTFIIEERRHHVPRILSQSE